jgi:phosphohistidine swiveling domain-containing protein
MRPQFDDPTEGQWMRDNAHYPTPVSAFGASIYNPALARAIETTAAEFGLMVEQFVPYWRSGEMYARVVPVGGKEGPAPPWWLLAVLSRAIPAMRKRMGAADRVMDPATLQAIVDNWNDSGRDDFMRRIQELADVDLFASDDEALRNHLDRIVELISDGQLVHFRLFMPWLLATHRFIRTARSLLGWSDDRSLSILAGHSEASSAPGRELEAIALRIRERDDAEEIAAAPSPIDAIAGRDAELAELLTSWTTRWGLRACVYDPGAPTLAEQPELLSGLIRDAIKGDLATADTSTAVALAEAERKLSLADKRLFDADLAAARDVFPLREDNVLYTDNLACGLARGAALAIGRRLVARGTLAAVDDAVELFVGELRDALHSGTDVAELATRRRAERSWVGNNPGPNYINGAPPPPPDLRGLPTAGRLVNEAFMWAMMHEYPPEQEHAQNGGSLHGIAAWPGSYTGEVRIVRSEDDLADVRPGDVLVARITVPAWSVVFPRIGALVTDRGGVLSHAAIVAREHGIPTVLSTRHATTALTSGQRVTVDGDRGIVTPC